jgi:hypothetical protein
VSTVLEAMGHRLNVSGLVTLGVDTFLSRMPDKPDYCVALFEYDGGPPMQTLGPIGIALDRVRVQVMARGGRDDYPSVRNRMLSIRTNLSAITDETILGVRILRASPQSYPTLMGYDDNNRFRIVFNMEVTAEPVHVAGFGLDVFGISGFGGTA